MSAPNGRIVRVPSTNAFAFQCETDERASAALTAMPCPPGVGPGVSDFRYSSSRIWWRRRALRLSEVSVRRVRESAQKLRPGAALNM
jgi:hypothetical protein